ncbi:MAG: hypothetical protein ABIK61_00340 [candidate division WOR-3 bacterium]
MKILVKFLVFCMLTLIMFTTANAYEIIKSYSFDTSDKLDAWNTNYNARWEFGTRDKKGSVSWSSEYGGTAKLTVSGAPCAIHFWRTLPIDLTFGDQVIIKFYTPSALYPIGGFDIILGPAEPHGHKQSVSVSTESEGYYTVNMPIWTPGVFKSGTPFGVCVSVWPGSLTIYIKKILLVRESEED